MRRSDTSKALQERYKQASQEITEISTASTKLLSMKSVSFAIDWLSDKSVFLADSMMFSLVIKIDLL